MNQKKKRKHNLNQPKTFIKMFGETTKWKKQQQKRIMEKY